MTMEAIFRDTCTMVTIKFMVIEVTEVKVGMVGKVKMEIQSEAEIEMDKPPAIGMANQGT